MEVCRILVRHSLLVGCGVDSVEGSKMNERKAAGAAQCAKPSEQHQRSHHTNMNCSPLLY